MSPQTVRRLVLVRQHLAGPRPQPTREALLDLIRDLGYLQLDPISVVARSHQLVPWSRLGPYDPADLEALQWEERRLFEYWAYRASIVLTEDYPIHHLLMRTYPHRRTSVHSQRSAVWLESNRKLRDHILRRLRTHGPLRLRDFEDRAVVGWTSPGWTNERNVGRMLDLLWTQGRIAVAGRSGVDRLWDMADRWLPGWTPRRRLSDRQIVRAAAQRSLRALGTGTARHIQGHFTADRYPGLPAVLAELARKGDIHPIRVAADGIQWPGAWFVHREDVELLDRLESGTWEPRTTLLSPFDNLIAARDRTERIFDFAFRSEIYVPPAKRRYGYYVLPILQGDRLIGRIDPVMDRRRNRLVVNSVHVEPTVPADARSGRAVAAAIEDLARFLAAAEVEYGARVPAGWRRSLR